MHRPPSPLARPRAGIALASLALVAACKRDAPPPPPPEAPAPATIAPTGAASADVVSHASPVWTDQGPAVLAGGSVDGPALRQKTRARITADRSPVTMLQGGTPLALGQRLCEAVFPHRPPETPILLKPNMGGFEWFKTGDDNGVTGRTTDPEFVRGVIRCLKARGYRKITVAEGWGATHADWERLVKVSGYGAMAAEEHVPLVAMDDDGTFDKIEGKPGLPLAISGMEKTDVPTLLLPKILAEHLDHGLFVSLPKIKHHRFGVASVAIKGTQGTVMLSDKSPAYNNKWRMHKELTVELTKQAKSDPEARKKYVAALETFARRIATAFELSAPHVVLAEGAPSMMGDGFRDLTPLPVSVAIGGTNPIAVDRVAHEWLGVWDNDALARELGGHRTSPLLTEAAARFGVDLSAVTVTGDGAPLLARPRPLHFVGMAGFTLDGPVAAPVTAGASAEAAATPPFEAHASPGRATIDGRGDDPDWSRAIPVQFATNWRGEPGGPRTTARFLYGPEGLYARFDLEGAGLFTDTSRPTATERAKLYEEDCVELFLAPDPKARARYAEIELGPYGHFFDLWVTKTAGRLTSDVGWTSAPTLATTRDPTAHRATIEVLLAAPELRAALRPGARLPMNLFRMEGRPTDPTGRRYLAWSPTGTPKPNFHVPEAFGALVLER